MCFSKLSWGLKGSPCRPLEQAVCNALSSPISCPVNPSYSHLPALWLHNSRRCLHSTFSFWKFSLDTQLVRLWHPSMSLTRMVGEGKQSVQPIFYDLWLINLLHKSTDGPSWKLGLETEAAWFWARHLTSCSSRQLEIAVLVAHHDVPWIKRANVDEVLNIEPVIWLSAWIGSFSQPTTRQLVKNSRSWYGGISSGKNSLLPLVGEKRKCNRHFYL